MSTPANEEHRSGAQIDGSHGGAPERIAVVDEGNDVAICICAHNEARTIAALVSSMMDCEPVQQGAWPLYVMASGCTDDTVAEVVRIAEAVPTCVVNVSVEEERTGKIFSVNRFVRGTRAEILIFADADVCLGRGSLEALVDAMRTDASIGIAAPRRQSMDPPTDFWGFGESLQAAVHNWSEPPKVGRLYAIRRHLAHVDEQAAADDTFQEWACLTAGMRIARVHRASLSNQGPRTVADYVGLRRRVVALHLNLYRRTSYKPVTMRRREILVACWRRRQMRYSLWFVALLGLEASAFSLAWWDVYVRREEYVRWPMIETTKEGRADAVAPWRPPPN